MNTPLITMEPEEAERRMKAYSARIGKTKGKALSVDVRAEYESIRLGYKALAKGTPLLDLDDAIAHGGFDAKGRPRLAIGPAHRKVIEFAWDQGQARFRPTTWNSWRTLEKEQRFASVRPPKSSARERRPNGHVIRWEGYARVPVVPADVRPKFGCEKDWFILWEVEKWADERRHVEPDRDPYLLKHLGGSLYAVIAEWDLTDLERSVMKRTTPA